MEHPSGAYMGQKAPGLEPEIFAPGFISTALSELNSVFTPDGQEFYFAVSRGRHFGYTIFVTRIIGGIWSTPVVASFTDGVNAIDISVTFDGSRLYFCSDISRTGGTELQDNSDIWYVERQADGSWGKPINPGKPLNSDQDEIYPTTTTNGTLYFQSDREGGFGGRDIYRATLAGDEFLTPENLGPTINTSSGEYDVLVAPDESYIIFNSQAHDPEGGESGLCISFHRSDGSWTDPRNMARYMAGHQSDFCPMLSPDGKYLFFSSGRLNPTFASADISYQTLQNNHAGPGGGLGDIYWIDASIIETARREILGNN